MPDSFDFSIQHGVRKIARYIVLFLFVLGGVFLIVSDYSLSSKSRDDFSIYLLDYNVENLSDTPQNKLIKLGRKLIDSTSIYLGETSTDFHVGNVLNCTNCHLDSGTKAFGIPLIGVTKRFPQYRGREDKIGTIEDRINGCFERSMNGRKLDVNSLEMQAFVAYIDWLSRYIFPNERVAGKGLKSIVIPNRAVNLQRGKQVYENNCALCHGIDGFGVKRDNLTYEYPPLWGPNSYNNGAGMTRVLTAAQFIKYNMPLGVTYNSPLMTDDQAYDVAGYINQQLRPMKDDLEIDFPNRLKKPVSTPYPPYADPFPQSQHALGPFEPIIAFYKKNHQISKTK